MKFEEICFDLDDKNLLSLETSDLQAKVVAIRDKLLPKLVAVTKYSIKRINEIYQTDVGELSTISKSPQFRDNRKKEIVTNRNYAVAGLTSHRSATLWKNIKNKNGTQAKIVGFHLSYFLDKDGLIYYFKAPSPSHFQFLHHKENVKLFCHFHNEYEHEVESILERVSGNLDVYFRASSGDIEPLPHDKYLAHVADEKLWDVRYRSRWISFPVDNEIIDSMVEDFVAFYPLYESYLRIASGQPIVIAERIKQYENYFGQEANSATEDEADSVLEGKHELSERTFRARNGKIIVMKKELALREQKTLRCEACGFDFETAYGDLGRGFMECHHLMPLSTKEGEAETNLADLSLLCSNCHRMIHRIISQQGGSPTVAEFQKIIRS
jgi:hypothetical protein